MTSRVQGLFQSYNKISLPGSRALLSLLIPIVLAAQTGPVFLDEADLRDDALLQVTLSANISPDDIRSSEFAQDLAEKQADEMLAASQRRIKRMEVRIGLVEADVKAGKAKASDLTPLLDQMHLRIEKGRMVLERTTVVKQLIQSAREEATLKAMMNRKLGRGTVMEKFGGNGKFSPSDLALVEKAYSRRFGRMLPISADGDTSLHHALGLDHTGRVDVAVSPDQPEGVWLRKYLETLRIPYYAFRRAVIGSATGPHIHIGPPSIRHRGPRIQSSRTKESTIPTFSLAAYRL